MICSGQMYSYVRCGPPVCACNIIIPNLSGLTRRKTVWSEVKSRNVCLVVYEGRKADSEYHCLLRSNHYMMASFSKQKFTFHSLRHNLSQVLLFFSITQHIILMQFSIKRWPRQQKVRTTQNVCFFDRPTPFRRSPAARIRWISNWQNWLLGWDTRGFSPFLRLLLLFPPNDHQKFSFSFSSSLKLSSSFSFFYTITRILQSSPGK